MMEMAMDCDELSDAVRVNESVSVSPAFRALTVVLELSAKLVGAVRQNERSKLRQD